MFPIVASFIFRVLNGHYGRELYCIVKHTEEKKKKTKNLGLKLSYNSAIPLLGIYPEETVIEKNTCTPMFIAALFTTARI